MIGVAVNQIYVPSPSNNNPSISFNYWNSCDECLCYALSSTTVSFVAINCLTNKRLCWFYTNYTENYSFQWNSTSYLYLFQLPPLTTTTISSSTATVSTSTTSSSKTSTITIITMPTTSTSTSIATTTTVSTSTRTSTTVTISTIRTSTSTSSSTRSTTSTTTQRPIVSITSPGDRIIGLYNTTAGQFTGGFNGSYSNVNEYPRFAIDTNTSTKYLNFGYKGCSGCIVYGPGIGTGFFVTPSISNATIAQALLFATANDSPNRDPITITLEGSNASTITMLHQGSSWTLIYNGSTGISPTIDPGRETYVIQQNFSNTLPYSSYRLLITSQRGNDSSVQFSESRIIGYL